MQKFVDISADMPRFFDVAIYIRDIEKTLVFVTPAVEALVGRPATEMIGHKCYEFFGDGEGKCPDDCPIERAWQSQEELSGVERTIKVKNGTLVTVRMTALPYFPAGEDEQRYFIVVLTNLDAQKRLTWLAGQKPPSEPGSEATAPAFRLETLVDIKHLQRLQDQFAQLFGVASLIFDVNGTPITRPSNFSSLCQLIRATEKGMANCRRSDRHLNRRVQETQQPVFSICESAGQMWDAIVPIVVNGRHIANWGFGQVLTDEPDEASIRAYAREIGADEEQMAAAFRKIPRLPAERMQQMTQFLFELANQVTLVGFQALQRNNALHLLAQTEQQLVTERDRFKLLFEEIPIGVFIQQDNRIVELNTALVRLMGGQQKSEFLGRRSLDFVDEHDVDFVSQHTTATVAQHKPAPPIVVRLHRVDGKLIKAEVQGMPFTWRGRDAFLETVTDVTQREEAARRLATSEAKYRSLVEHSPDVIVLVDAEARITFANKQFGHVFGPPLDRGEHLSLFDIIHQRDIDAFQSAWLKAYEHRTSLQNMVCSFLDREGVQRDFAIEGSPVFSLHDDIMAYQLVLRDVTEQRRTQRKLQETGEQLQGLINAMPDIVVFKDGEGRWLLANDFALKLFELEGTPYKGKTEPELANYTPFYADAFRQCDNSDALAWEQGKTIVVEENFPRSNGKFFISETIKVPLYHPDGRRKGLLVLGRDITERKAVTEALRQSEQNFRALIENSNDAIYVLSPDKHVLFVNPKFVEMFHYPAEQLLAKDFDIKTLIAPESYQFFRERAEKQDKGEPVPSAYEFKGITKEGAIMDLDVNESPVEWRGQPAALGTLRDVTERKLLEAQLQQAQKMEAIGQLAGGIAHDFNNMLGALKLHLSLLERNLSLEGNNARSMRIVKETVSKAADMTSSILTFSRHQVSRSESVDMNEAIRNVLRILEKTFDASVKIHTAFQDRLPRIEGNRTEIEQIILNLSINARDAMPAGGELFVETRTQTFVDNVPGREDAEPGTYVVLTVTDSGCGIPPEIQDRIFEPFFTNKENGTGLGLFTVYSIVKNHNGWIQVDSRVGEGATFQLYFPAAAFSAGDQEADTVNDVTGETESQATILIAEDNAAMREGLQDTLEFLGYDVIVTGNGVEAVAAFQAHQKEIDAAILDLSMPKMNGSEAFRRIRRLDETLPVLISTGYTEDQAVVGILEDERVAFIQKPYDIDQLSAQLQRMLNRHPERNE